MRQKAQAAPMTNILTIGVVLVFLFLLYIFDKYQGLPGIEVQERIERLSFFERSKSILNTLNTVESGEITERLSKPTDVELIKTPEGSFLQVMEKKDKILADILPGKVTSEKISFVKRKGKPIEIRD